jgi:hypothetical protein
MGMSKLSRRFFRRHFNLHQSLLCWLGPRKIVNLRGAGFCKTRLARLFTAMSLLRIVPGCKVEAVRPFIQPVAMVLYFSS